MSMDITFFVVPDEMTNQIMDDKKSIIEAAQYVKENYADESVRERLGLFSVEFYYFQTFSILNTLFELAFGDSLPSLLGYQSGFAPCRDEDIDLLLSEYVTYSGGVLAFDQINTIYKAISCLSIEELYKRAFKINTLDFGAIGEDILNSIDFDVSLLEEECPLVTACYEDLKMFLKRIVDDKSVMKRGLFIAID